MLWTNTPTTEQRLKFVTSVNSVSELCLEFGINRSPQPTFAVRDQPKSA